MNRYNVKKNSPMQLKLIKHDFMLGIVHAWKTYLPVLIVSILSCSLFWRKMNLFLVGNSLQLEPSFADYLLDFFKGMEIYIPNSGIIFKVPGFWLFFNLYLAYLIAYYPKKDLHANGLQIILRAQNRRLWWLSKCLWNIGTVLCYYALVYGVIIIFSSLTGKVSLELHHEIISNISKINSSFLIGNSFWLTLIVLPIVTSIALSLLEMGLSFIINPTVSLIVIIFILVISAYYCREGLLGNYLMVMRNQLAILNLGVNTTVGITISSILAFCSVVIGTYKFKTLDIVKK